MYDDYITLVRKESIANECGTPVEKEVGRREVFCKLMSVSMKETYEALAVGAHPEIKVILADYLDYEFERYAVLGDDEYCITRTYKNGRELEITLERVNDDAGS